MRNKLMRYGTEQESFWAGKFGDDYIERNKDRERVISNVMLFSKILAHTGPIKSAIEFGANIGLNLLALRKLLPSIQLGALEINSQAAQELRSIEGVDVYEESIFDFASSKSYDLAFTRGVLIHIAPKCLNIVYDKLFSCANKYILVAEYYNPKPTEVTYRGHKGKLFKRDFAGEMLDRFNDLRLVDYGFVYHRDLFPQDDITWFLMEKR